MKLFSNIMYSIRFAALWGLLLPLLLCGPAAASEYPKTVCDGDSCSFWASATYDGKPTSTFNKRGKFSVKDSGKNSVYVDKPFSLILANGYGDVYFLNLLRDRENYQAYRGYCTYRGFSLSGCATAGEAVLIRIKTTPSMTEHISLMSTSWRWDTTQYILNDVVRPLCSWVYAGYENWYPFDMSCSVAIYFALGGWN
jgi:hypothetical protein